MNALDNFYLNQNEPIRACFLALREIIMTQDPHISHQLKYGMPFFSYKGKMFCYLWVHKKYKQPYLGIVEGGRLDYPELIQEKRSRMKIMLLDPQKDLPLSTIKTILQQALALYKSDEIKIK